MTGVIIEDRNETNGLFDKWTYILYQAFNNRPRFVYGPDENGIYSDLQYDNYDGWIIEIRIGAGTETIYASDTHGTNPPGDEWIVFRLETGNRRLLLQTKEFFISYLVNEDSITDSQIPTISPLLSCMSMIICLRYSKLNICPNFY